MNDLKNDLQTIADRHANQAGGDFDTVLRTATTRGRRRVAGISAVACAVLAVGAIATLSPWQNDAEVPVATPTPTPKPTLDPKYQGTMTITPATAAPGKEIELSFPEEYLRGVGFTIGDPVGGSVQYYLISARKGEKPTWSSATDPNGPRAVTDIGVYGPARVVVPDTAADGTYLLCTDNARPKACALLTVAR
ncbi:hypothetical protein [Kribbella sp. CA-294648]|uniref:hypothetical protein n=1 Tax=Kribbella sp. CA-294648 TaxID=3239948 RepID=UPI003D944A2B